MSQDVLNLTVFAYRSELVEPGQGGSSVVKVNSGDTVYYADTQQVSSANNQGSIVSSASHTFTSNVWLRSAGTSSVTVTTTTGTAGGQAQDVVPGSDGLIGGPGGTGLTASVVSNSRLFNVADAYAGSISAAVSAANAAGGGTVYLRAQAAHYTLPAGVTLNPGVSIIGDWGADPVNTPGTWVDVTDTTNPAFTLKSGCRLQGLSFYYPNQSWNSGTSAPNIAYPATIKADSGAISRRVVIRDVFLMNAYNGLDLTAQHEMWTVENVNGYCINIGLDLDYMTDVDRISGVHFNPNAWDIATSSPHNYATFDKWTWNNGIAFRVWRADNPMFRNMFAFGYSEGLHADLSAHGAPGRAQWIGGAFDGCKRAANMATGSQWVFSGTSFDAYNWDAADIGATSALPAVRIAHFDGITFDGCVFYQSQTSHISAIGVASLILNGCSFQNWGTNGGAAHTQPCVQLLADTATPRRCFYEINGCLFQWSESTQSSTAQDAIEIGTSAVQAFTTNIVGNTFDNIGGVAVQVDSGGDNYQAASNVFSRCATPHINRAGTPTNAIEGPNLVLA